MLCCLFDNIYCFRFPSKEDVVEFVVRVTKRSLAKQPKTLIVVGAYSIGKEHVYLAISEALGVCANVVCTYYFSLICYFLFARFHL